MTKNTFKPKKNDNNGRLRTKMDKSRKKIKNIGMNHVKINLFYLACLQLCEWDGRFR